jgi:hypothetical protein
MSEIEKLYKLAGIEPDIDYICDIEPPCEESLLYGCEEGVRICNRVESYPEFTAEKLINLVMFLINKDNFNIKKGSKDITFESFTSCIAGLINNLWQDLTEEERQQVKGILECVNS